MTWTTPATPIAGTAITVAFYGTNIRDNLSHLRGMLPDAGGANQMLVSSSTTAATWTSSPTITGTFVQTGGALTHRIQRSSGDANIIQFVLARQAGDLWTFALPSGSNDAEIGNVGTGTFISFVNGVGPTFPRATIFSSTVNISGTLTGAGANFSGTVTASSFGSLSASSGSFSGNVTSTANFIGERFECGSGSGEYLQKTGTGSEIGLYVDNTFRYKQTDSLALFQTPGQYTTSWTAVSDKRLKSNIEPASDALALIRKLKPITYTQSRTHAKQFGSRDERRRHGLIAQDVREVIPDLVEGTESEDEYLSIDYARLSVLNTAAIQELANRIDALMEGA